MKKHLLDLFPEDLEQYVAAIGERPYRLKQLRNWIFSQNISDPDDMTNLPLAFRNKLFSDFDLYVPELIREQISQDGTRKFLLKLIDDQQIEMVLIPYLKKRTLCVSSQVGCSRKCSFCATGTLGLTRNLAVNEILGQILLARRLLGEEKLTNIVFMGMGEPLDNYDNLISSIKILQHEYGFKFSPRKITVSTAGIIPGIEKLAYSGLKLKLAVSLNSAIQEKRSQLMPVTEIYPLKELKRSLLSFSKRNPYRITFEYIMIKDFNTGLDDARALTRFIGDISSKVNLIKWNAVKGLPYETPDQKEIDNFIELLLPVSRAITFRQSRGADIKAACGQLAAEYS